MADECTIDGSLDDLCAQIESGEAAEGFVRQSLWNLQLLRECTDEAARLSFLLHSPRTPGEPPWRDAWGVPEPSQTFKERLRAMLRREGLVGEEVMPGNFGVVGG